MTGNSLDSKKPDDSKKTGNDGFIPTNNVANDAEVNSPNGRAVADEHELLESSDTTLKEAPLASLHEVPAKGNILILRDNTSTKYALPYEQCKTWAGFQGAIKRIYKSGRWPNDYGYLNNDVIVPLDHPDCRFYDIKSDLSIISDYWETMVEPEMVIGVDLFASQQQIQKSQSLKNSSNAYTVDLKAVETQIDTTSGKTRDPITYAIDIWEKDKYNGARRRVGMRTIEQPPALSRLMQLAETQNTESVIQEVSHLDRNTTTGEYGPATLSMDETELHFDESDTIHPPTLKILSKFLLNSLKAVIKFQNFKELPEPSMDEGQMPVPDVEKGVFKFPYADLYHNLGRMMAYREDGTKRRARHSDEYNQKCDEHLQVLEGYLRNHPGIGLQDVEARWNRPTPVTNFKDLWLLFKPGDDIYGLQGGEMSMFVVDTISSPQVLQGNIVATNPFFVITAWYLDYDGTIFGRSIKKFAIPRFYGERDILSLPCYPRQFHVDGESLQNRLIERGKKFATFVKNGHTYQQYTGIRISQEWSKMNRARVVIDHTNKPWNDLDSYSSLIPTVISPIYADEQEQPVLGFPPWQPPPPGRARRNRLVRRPASPRETGFERLEASRDEPVEFDEYKQLESKVDELTEHQLMLCSYRVHGYVLNERIWEVMSVSGLTEPDINRNIIDKLVLRSPGTIQMIKSLCEQYTEKHAGQENLFSDYIQGKGDGNIFLLHGPPGTGKTLTAESVAEYTARPLLNIAAADLGYDAERLEMRLLEFFQNATKWNAIVLLDEADVYLERRSTMDLERNNVVSVFLRALDYFQGLLFLTTNRIGAFDEAFMSRIHLKIQYEAFNKETRQEIWRNGLEKLTADYANTNREIQWSYEAKEYVRKDGLLEDLGWNGREIRNAIKTAVALASFDAKKANNPVPRVVEQHLIMIVDMSKQFGDYMYRTLKGTEAEIASQRGLRHDNYVPRK